MSSAGLALAAQHGDGSFGRPEVVRNGLLSGDGLVQVAIGDGDYREIVVLLAEGEHVELAPSDDRGRVRCIKRSEAILTGNLPDRSRSGRLPAG